jgi:hypothetical protein
LNARAFCLSVRGFTRQSIGQPFAFDAFERLLGALGILNAKAGTIIVTKVELGEIAMQVRLAHVVIDTRDAALEDRIEVLGRVDMDKARAYSLFAERGIDHAFVAHKHAGAVGVGDDKGPDGFSADICNMKGLDAPATLNERKNGFLRRGFFVSAVLGLPANICFIHAYRVS